MYLLKTHEVDILSLDHDLGEDLQGNLLPTGYDLVKYICEKGLRVFILYMFRCFNFIISM
ncbi:cyclic-phosphate processing receiver domain-containing protein [Solibacillus sp. FSL K6-1126]|uniref:cyclic-phosphate processing receiver domain-containing protein n=1 Tax=Solibacillus sp. FSL K6-1126 TaxID=2921463 RepID=UPI004046CCE2